MRLYFIALLACIVASLDGVDGQNDCDDFKADVVFLLDTSRSISGDDLSVLVDFLKRVVKQVKISADDVRVSVVTFAEQPSLVFGLTKNANEDQVISNLDDIGFEDGPVRIDKALDFLKSDVFSGVSFRPGAGRVVVLVADGPSADRTATMVSLDNIKGENNTIITLSIGDNGQEDELGDIASDPDDRFRLMVDSFGDLDEYVGTFAGSLCEALLPVEEMPIADGSCESFKADVVFAIDNSHSVKQVNFDKVINFVSKIIESMTIGEEDVRVGLFLFSTDVTLGFSLGAHNTKDDVLAAVQNIQYTGGLTNTHLALDYLKSDMFSSDKNRPNITDIVILLSDGQSTNSDETLNALARIQGEGYTIFTLGITDDIDKDELNAISSDPDSTHSVTVKDFDDLQEILDAFATQICEETTEASCGRSQADIIIVLDASSSIGRQNFEKVKKFLVDLVRQFTISPDDVRVSLLSFATKTRLEFYLDTHQTKGAVLAALRGVKYTRGKTYTNKAIKFLREEMLQGRGNRPNVTDIVIFLSDGQSTESQKTRAEIEELKKIALTVFSIGIGSKVDTDELNAISSEPNDFYTSLVDDFDSLDSIKASFTQKTCEATPPPPIEQPKCRSSADLLIIMDASSSIGNSDYDKQKAFVKELISSFIIGPDDVQVALIVFNSEAYVEFYLDTFNDTDAILTAVDNAHGVSSGTYTNLALQKAREEIFQESRGARDDVPYIAILLTDGRSREPDKTKEQAEKLQGANVGVISVGIGGSLNVGELQLIASDPDDRNVLRAANYDALSSLLDSIVNVTCEAAVPPTMTPSVNATDCRTSADVLIIMDASSSIGNSDYNKEKAFVKQLIGSFAVGPDDVQVALIVFNSQPYVEFYLDASDDVSAILAAVDGVHGVSVGTYTHLALAKAREDVLQTSRGRREDVPLIVILLTDGRSTKGEMTKTEAQNLRDTGAEIVAVGIGGNIDPEELKAIASDPDETHVMRAADFDALSSFLESLVKVTCEATPPPIDPPDDTCKAVGDLVLVVDISTSVGMSEITEVKRVLKDIITGLQVGKDRVRVSLVAYDIIPEVIHEFKDEQSRGDILQSIDNLAKPGYGSWAHRAFHMIRTEVLQKSAGERQNANDVVVVFTDGLTREPSKATLEAEKLKENGAKIIVVGTNGYYENYLRALSSSPSDEFFFTVKDFNGLDRIKELLLDQNCSKPTSCGVEADIVVLMDASTSIEKEDFDKMKDFVKDLLSGFEIGPSHVRVGLATFNYDAIMEFQLDSFSTKHQVLMAVDAVSGRGADTRTDKALRVVRDVMFSEDNGDRPGVPDMLIVLTDGRSRFPEETIKQALEIHREKITVFAIGIGSRISEKELKAIASSPSSEFVYEVENFQGLSAIESSLQRKACGLPPPVDPEGAKIQADIVFVIDSCDRVLETHFQLALEFASYIVKSVRVSRKWARFGIIKYATDAVLEMTLDSYFTRNDILTAISQIERSGWDFRVEKALRQLRTLAFKDCLGGRPDVPDVAIILTSGQFTNIDAARYEALLMRNAGIRTYVIGIGRHVDKFQLEILSITPYSKTVFVAESKEDIHNILPQLIMELNSELNVCY